MCCGRAAKQQLTVSSFSLAGCHSETKPWLLSSQGELRLHLSKLRMKKRGYAAAQWR
jgi:hypothetical protein